MSVNGRVVLPLALAAVLVGPAAKCGGVTTQDLYKKYGCGPYQESGSGARGYIMAKSVNHRHDVVHVKAIAVKKFGDKGWKVAAACDR